MQQEAAQLGSTFQADCAFIDPEILKIDNATLLRFIAQEPRLRIYRHYLDNVTRLRTHTLNEAEEKLLATSNCHGQWAIEHLQHFFRCRIPLSNGNPGRWQDRKTERVQPILCTEHLPSGKIGRRSWPHFLVRWAGIVGRLVPR